MFNDDSVSERREESASRLSGREEVEEDEGRGTFDGDAAGSEGGLRLELL